MKIAKLAAMTGLGILALSASAEARTWSGYSVANVNERAGPSTAYPSVAVIPAGAPIVIYGCLNDNTWCDVSWGPNRGWMSAAYLQVTYQSRRVSLHDYIAPLGIPFVTFNFDTYWGDYYRHRSFFGQENQWRHTHADHNQLPPPPKWPKNQDSKPGTQSDNNQNGSGNPPSGPDSHKPPKSPDNHFNNNGGQQTGSTGMGMQPKGGIGSQGMKGNSFQGGKPGHNSKPDCNVQDPGPGCPKN